ncbi:Elicitor peptide [Arabidopsis suecica]|uniref:Elicitor peptide n=1 Tax=Arabidopsis suecica TaxID=45249 RepID=A0A8T1Z8V4_ARASU|nr:Elicitor peptide [Arabidopsis suecica]
MEGEGRREDGDNCSYLCIPFNFIGDIFRSFFWSLPTPPDNSPISQEDEEETEVVICECDFKECGVGERCSAKE